VKKAEERVVLYLLTTKDEWSSRSDVGRGVGLKRTPYLSNMLDDLVERGVIERSLGSWGGFSCWFYRALPEVVQTFIAMPIADWIKVSNHD
jgi:hypothetical protein